MYKRAYIVCWPFFLLGLLMLAGCGVSREKGLTPSPDWSRSVKLGEAVTGSAAMVMDPQGEGVYLVWLNSENGQPGIHLIKLDQQAEIVFERQLAPLPGQLRMPRLTSDGSDRLHLFWARRGTAKDQWELWHAPLTEEGNHSGAAEQISAPEMNIKDYLATQLPSGEIAVIWSSSSGIYGIKISDTGKAAGSPILINETGSTPNAKVDNQGNLHLSWIGQDAFYYALLSDGKIRAVEGIPVARVALSTGDSLSGPVLGLTDDHVHLIWSVQSQSGLAAGTARTEFTSFPIGIPGITNAQPVWILPLEEQFFEAYQGSYAISFLSPPADPRTGSDFVHQPAVTDGQDAELAAAMTVKQQYRQDVHIQIALCLFENGKFKGYEMASKTKAFSSEPLLAADKTGNLHLVWRQGAMGRDLYYATTAPQARAELNRLNSNDILNAVLTGGMESFVGLLFFPWIGLGWLLPGLVVVGIWKIVRDDDSLNKSLGSLILLIIALITYQIVKLVSLPSITFYVPFSAWIEIPISWRIYLQIGVPIAILGLALMTAETRRRKKSNSAVTYYFAFAGVDALLTLAIYGVGFLGVY
jgi:hypothetical protein